MQKVVVGEGPRKEVQRSAKPFGSIVDGREGRRTYRGQEEGDRQKRDLQTNKRNKIIRWSAPQLRRWAAN